VKKLFTTLGKISPLFHKVASFLLALFLVKLVEFRVEDIRIGEGKTSVIERGKDEKRSVLIRGLYWK